MACRQWLATLLCWKNTLAPLGFQLLYPSPPDSGIWKCQSAKGKTILWFISCSLLVACVHLDRLLLLNDKGVKFLATGEMLHARHMVKYFQCSQVKSLCGNTRYHYCSGHSRRVLGSLSGEVPLPVILLRNCQVTEVNLRWWKKLLI